MSVSKLFQPIRVGRMNLQHRAVLSPMTRLRANNQHVHGDLGLEYYTQRASTPGTLLITEATVIHPRAGGLPNVPYIYTDDQITAWRRITDAVREKRSFIYLQLWAIGPSAKPEILEGENPGQGVVPVGPSDVKVKGATVTPRPLAVPEIKEYVQWFRRAAEVAVNQAGFDGIMIHAANGYLIDQFLQDVSNKRTDEYGGSIENRARFALEVVEAITKAIGEDRTAIRVSPWATMYGMRMDDPKPTFAYLARRIKELYPNFAFFDAVEVERPRDGRESNEFLREIWAPNVFMSNSGYDRQKGMNIADRTGELVGFGKLFLANPDLPRKLKEDLPLNKADPKTFYAIEDPKGYTDWPFAEERAG